MPAIQRSWPEANGQLHIDAWREVTQLPGYKIHVQPVSQPGPPLPLKLFFINLGGYKPGDFEEYHYKLIVAAENKGEAIRQAKQSAFYKHTGFKGAVSHVDDKFGIDVDNSYEIEDILPEEFKSRYRIFITLNEGAEDELHIGYFVFAKL